MELSLAELAASLNSYYWPFLRLSALFLAAPVFGARTVPVRVRIILAVLVTLLLQPALTLSAVDPFSVTGVLTAAQEICIGLLMGFMLQMMFAALVIAGQAVATAMGLGFASMADPQSGVEVTVLGQFYLITATLLFLLVDGHLAMIAILADSYAALPTGPNFFAPDLLWRTVLFGGQMFAAATLVALPAMAGVLLVNFAFGVITRAAPQLNIFAMGFTIILLAGFVLLLLSLPVLLTQLQQLFDSSLAALRGLVN